MNYDKIVSRRVMAQDHFRNYRKVQHTLRRLIANDLSPLGLTKQQRAPDDPNQLSAQNEWSNWVQDNLYDILVTDVTEGHSNQMWAAVKTLVMQSAYKMPVVEFEDLSSEEASMNQAYLKVICGSTERGCNAVDQHRLALVDYCIGGTGAVSLVFREGRPAIEYTDILDLTWDTSPKLIPDISWSSRKVRKPLWEWIDMFGRTPFEMTLGTEGTEEEIMDRRIELEWYYDRTGKKGRGCHYVLHPGGNNDDNTGPAILDEAENPFYCEIDGYENPFIPTNFSYFMQVPGVRFPVSIVGMMLPHQVAIWRMEANFGETVKRARETIAVDENAFDPDEYNKFIRNQTGGVVKIKKGGKLPEVIPGLKLAEIDFEYYQYHARELTSQGGANPYSGGNRVEGVDFSSEVVAINSAGELMAHNVGRDHTEQWGRSCSMLLKAGATYDVKDIALRMDEQTIQFHGDMPINLFLRPDGDLVVKENSTAFRPRAERMGEAANTLTIAQNLMTARPDGRYAAFLDQAVEGYLRATGEKNIAAWLEMPQMAPVDPAVDPAAAGMDQEAQVQAMAG